MIDQLELERYTRTLDEIYRVGLRLKPDDQNFESVVREAAYNALRNIGPYFLLSEQDVECIIERFERDHGLR